MDESDLRRLAEHGLVAFPFAGLETLAVWLQDFGEATGDARWMSLSLTICTLDEWRDAMSGQMMPETLPSLDQAFREQLPAVLETKPADDAAPLARLLRESVQRILAADAEQVRQRFREKHRDG